MKSREFITELFDRPLPYKWISKDNDLWTSQFTINSDPILKIRVDFDYNKDLDSVEIAFVVNNKFEITGTGHAIEIFSTVSHIVKEYIMQNMPNKVVFSANSSELSRVKLYSRLAKDLAAEFGYKTKVEHVNWDVKYKLQKI